MYMAFGEIIEAGAIFENASGKAFLKLTMSIIQRCSELVE